MLARNILAVAAAGGLAMGSLTAMAWQPRMTMAPMRPWQGAGRAPDLRDFEPATQWRDAVPVAVPASTTRAVIAPMPRLALADDAVPQRPLLADEPASGARDAAIRDAEAETVIADTPTDPPADIDPADDDSD